MDAIDLATCPACGAGIPAIRAAGQVDGTCSECRTHILVVAFPRAVDACLEGRPGAPRSGEEQSACFTHPNAAAEVSCSRCGRFLCAVCSIEISGGYFCGPCLERADVQASEPFLVRKLERHDIAALAAFSFPLTIPSLVAIIAGLDDSIDTAIGVWIGLAIFLGIFAVPGGLYLLYRARQPQTANSKPTYLLVRLLALGVVLYVLSMIIGIGYMFATMD